MITLTWRGAKTIFWSRKFLLSANWSNIHRVICVQWRGKFSLKITHAYFAFTLGSVRSKCSSWDCCHWSVKDYKFEWNDEGDQCLMIEFTREKLLFSLARILITPALFSHPKQKRTVNIFVCLNLKISWGVIHSRPLCPLSLTQGILLWQMADG